jgi:hypothetical protein
MSRTKTDPKAAKAAARRFWQRARQTAEGAKPVAAQVKPLANDTKDAASRGLRKARVWAAPQVERTGQVLQESVAPKVAAALTSTARRLDPEKPKGHGWRKVAGVSALLAAAAAIGAALRNRAAPATAAADQDEPAPVADPAQDGADGAAVNATRTS